MKAQGMHVIMEEREDGILLAYYVLVEVDKIHAVTTAHSVERGVVTQHKREWSHNTF